MKRCDVCNKLADNGAKRCNKCGTEFPYDPKKMLFSETRIFIGLLILALVGWIIYRSIPVTLPDPDECSMASIRSFERIGEKYYRESRNVLRSEILFTPELSQLRTFKNEAEDIQVHPCLEPAKTDLVEYLDEVYFIGVYSSRGAYQGAAYRTEQAGYYWDAFNTEIDELKECVPDCP